jgi:general secretion pathway protein D
MNPNSTPESATMLHLLRPRRGSRRLLARGGFLWIGVALLIAAPAAAQPTGRPPIPGRPGADPDRRPGTPYRPPYTKPGTSGGQPPGGAPNLGGNTGFKDLPGEQSFNECKRFPYYKRVKVTLKPDSEIHDLIAWISGMTCKKFIITGTIRAPKVTLVSPTPISPAEAYRAFLSALNAMGLTVQPAGNYLKIVESGEGVASKPIATCGPREKCPADERIVTQLIRLRFVEPEDVAAVLRSLSKGSIITYAPTNLIILTDSGANIERLQGIIKHLDVEAQDERIWIVRLKFAEATDLAAKLLEVFPAAQGGKGTAGRPGAPVAPNLGRGRKPTAPQPSGAMVSVSKSGGGVVVSKIIADERTNALIILANERAYLQVRALIRKLDTQLAGGEDRIHIVPLANADAAEMATTLASLTGRGAGGARGASAGRFGAAGAQRGKTAARAGGAAGAAGARAGGAVSLFQGEVQITEDKATNSLIIVATAKDYLQLLKVIKQLDKPRKQVFVEASILEVAVSKQRDLGLSFHGGYPVGSGDSQSLLLGGNNATKSISLDPASLMGLAVGLRGPALENAEKLLGIPGITFPKFGVWFQALQSNNDVNIISQPHLLTTDNEEATISVGENVPFQSAITGMGSLGSLAGAAGGTTAGLAGLAGLGGLGMQSIQRQDVALTLKIIPHINDSDFVRLEIDQEINEVKSIDPTVGPTTTKRKIKTVVVVKDQQTVVLGGLITEKIKESVQKIPILGDIPLLGYLFKNTTKTIEKSNLLIFLTPYIIRDQSDLRRIFQIKIQQRKEFIERYTAFKDLDLAARIDYASKRGLLEEINRVAITAEEEAALKKKAMEESKDVEIDGPVRSDPTDEKLLRQLDKERERPREVDPRRPAVDPARPATAPAPAPARDARPDPRRRAAPAERPR